MGEPQHTEMKQLAQSLLLGEEWSEAVNLGSLTQVHMLKPLFYTVSLPLSPEI